MGRMVVSLAARVGAACVWIVLAQCRSTAAALPACNVGPNEANELSPCARRLIAPDSVTLYMDEKCRSPDCQRDAAKLQADNPTECLYNEILRLYADVLTPLRAHCASLGIAMPGVPAPQPAPLVSPATTTAASTTAPATNSKPPSTSAPSATASPTSAPEEGSSYEPTAPQNTASTASPPSRKPTASPSTRPLQSSGSGGDAGASYDPSDEGDAAPPVVRQSPSPVAQTSGDKVPKATTWILIAVAAVGVIVVVAVAVHRRRHSARATLKSQSGYVPHRSPNATDDDTRTDRSGATTAATDSGAFNLLSVDLRKQIDVNLQNDTTLEAWRLRGRQLTDKRFLGRGGHAFVHLVQLPDGICVAAKRLAPSQISLATIEQLIGEAHIVSTLQHRSIVSFVGVAWTSALDFQVLFEFMAGGDLRAYLDTNKPPSVSVNSSARWPPLKLQMALSVAEGLAYAHSFNPPLVHRDLKSRNVLLTNDLQAKISDFGVARFLSEYATMTTGVGTNRWLAPEVLAGGGTYGEKCDIYSFGVVLTELDTHHVPLANEMERDADADGNKRRRTELSLMQAIVKGELRPALSTSCPSVVRELAMQCLAFDADDRPNALELSYRLRSIVNGR